MQRYGWRLLRLVIVALLAWATFVLLEPYGLGWVVLPAALVVTLAVALGRWWWLRKRGVGREALWADAMVDARRRPKAIAEVREAARKLEPVTAATRSTHARLSALLAQLLDAHGKNDEGRTLLDAIDLGPLGAVDAAVVRHGRAVLALRADDPKGALAVLAGRPRKSGEPELDLRLDLLEASAKLELGEASAALDTATRVRRAAGGDEELIVEAHVVRATTLDALGQRADAVEVVRSLGPETIAMLTQLAPRRIRDLAEAARD